MPSWLESLLTTAVFLAGLAAVAVGAGLVYLPAGVMLAGVLASVCAYFVARPVRRGP